MEDIVSEAALGMVQVGLNVYVVLVGFFVMNN
jgi:hypothetical protein